MVKKIWKKINLGFSASKPMKMIRRIWRTINPRFSASNLLNRRMGFLTAWAITGAGIVEWENITTGTIFPGAQDIVEIFIDSLPGITGADTHTALAYYCFAVAGLTFYGVFQGRAVWPRCHFLITLLHILYWGLLLFSVWTAQPVSDVERFVKPRLLVYTTTFFVAPFLVMVDVPKIFCMKKCAKKTNGTREKKKDT